jgi:hypothetical protein
MHLLVGQFEQGKIHVSSSPIWTAWAVCKCLPRPVNA